jgi:PGF-CTERM protein
VDTGDAVFDRVDRAEFTDNEANGFEDTALRTARDVSASTGDEFEVTLFIGKEANVALATSEESVSSSFEVVEQTAEFDVNSDDAVEVESDSDQMISGETSLAPGTEITVRARASGDNPFLKTETARVNADGTFSATLNFSNVAEGTNFTASVREVDDTETDGIVSAPPTATVSVSDQTTDGTTVTVDSASLSNGGFVTIHDGSLANGAVFDSVRGTSAYLEAGSHSDIEVSLDAPYESDGTAIAMPHQDTNGNEAYDFVSSDGAEDGPYTADGAAVTDDASLTVETTTEETPTPSPSPTPTPDEETPTPTEDTPTPTDTEGQPGFGAALAIVALAGAALLALRRE